jgi:hypothetical protein
LRWASLFKMHHRRIRFELANSPAIGGKQLKLVGNCLQFFCLSGHRKH